MTTGLKILGVDVSPENVAVVQTFKIEILFHIQIMTTFCQNFHTMFWGIVTFTSIILTKNTRLSLVYKKHYNPFLWILVADFILLFIYEMYSESVRITNIWFITELCKSFNYSFLAIGKVWTLVLRRIWL